MSRIYHSAESEQPGITAPALLPEDLALLDRKIRTNVSAPQGELHLIPFFLDVKQISEYMEPSLKEHPSSYFPLDIELMPALEKRTGFEILFHYRIGFDASMGPWLPPRILDLLAKMKKRALSEQEAIRLMSALAERASEHYGLKRGKFVAITFSGKVVEVADTKIDLLKKIQGKRYSEQIFVWETTSESFTGWKR
ncbi:MAG: hypothetical protein ACE5Z5_04660 [Candidatus Bathyarchaeia archaeon]